MSEREYIFEVAIGDALPEGYEAVRILGKHQAPTGVGTNYVEIVTVAARRAAAGSEKGETT